MVVAIAKITKNSNESTLIQEFKRQLSILFIRYKMHSQTSKYPILFAFKLPDFNVINIHATNQTEKFRFNYLSSFTQLVNTHQ